MGLAALLDPGIAEPKPKGTRFSFPTRPVPPPSRRNGFKLRIQRDVKITPRPPTWEIDSFASHPAPGFKYPHLHADRAAALLLLLRGPWVAPRPCRDLILPLHPTPRQPQRARRCQRCPDAPSPAGR